jgi:polyribonucleotide nucleotidyltransferase
MSTHVSRTHIDPEKIGVLVGPGGKTVREIQQDEGVAIDVEDDGTVIVAGNDEDLIQRALERVRAVV